MDEQNKKQIVIIVIIIIVLVLILLGLLIVAVITNNNSGTVINSNTTTTTLTTTMSTTTLPVVDESSSVDENLVLQGIENYLSTLKNEGRIGEYIIGDIEKVSSQDTQSSLCPDVTYDSTKEYVSTVIDYVKIPGAQPLAEIEEYFADRAYASVYFSMKFDGNVYVVEEMFSC